VSVSGEKTESIYVTAELRAAKNEALIQYCVHSIPMFMMFSLTALWNCVVDTNVVHHNKNSPFTCTTSKTL
jgi:hypothetical protein